MRLRRNRPKLLASFATPRSCSVLDGFVQRVYLPGLRCSLCNPAIVVSLAIGMHELHAIEGEVYGTVFKC